MYVVASDIHLHKWTQFATTDSDGVNTRLKEILTELERAGDHLLKEGGKNFYIAGDLFHVRGSIPPSVLNPTLDSFKRMIGKGIEFRIIPGNHDLESKNSERVTSAVTALEALGCVVCNQTQIFPDDRVVMLPWYDDLNDLRNALADVRFDIEELEGEDEETSEMLAHGDYTAIIHAPLNGVIEGLPEHGLSSIELAELGFYRVLCGHYHNHKVMENGDVISIGALTHQTWSDVNSVAGYMVLHDYAAGFEQIESFARKFVDYDSEWDDAEAELYGSDNYVRVVVGESDEEEVRNIKAHVLEQTRAHSVIVHAKPKPKVGVRSLSAPKGTTLEASVEDWIGKNVEDNAEKVTEMALKIISETGVEL